MASDGLDAVSTAVSETASTVADDLAAHVGAADSDEENPSGEEQVAGDVWADSLFFEALSALECIGAYASEERAEIVDCGPDEAYAVAIDPLDGSSNLATNNPVGTIVGVYDSALPATGRNLVASFVVLYGPYTTMAVAREDESGAREYLLDGGEREYRRDIELPAESLVLGFGGKASERSAAFNDFAQSIERGEDLKIRYGGATVADLAQVLEYGGLFGYPATASNPDGKLRVLYESAPLAYLVERAGGASTDGERSLLDVDPEDPHGRTPTFLGNRELVDRVESELL